MTSKTTNRNQRTAAGARPARRDPWSGAPRGAHEWVSFPDPDYERTWMFDVTFLESRWTCIFARGCKGVLTGPAPELVQGCCSYGAHFTGAKDARRVQSAAAKLSEEQWQFSGRARRGATSRPDVIVRNKTGELTTKIVKGACIFLNRPGFPGGAGCALHRAALEQGVEPLVLKPDVCWQLPLRRDDEVGEGGHVTSVIRQWDRRDWGKGGQEFHWWCTEAPDAFVGERAVFEEMEHELVAMVGRKIYKRLAGYMRTRAAVAARDGSGHGGDAGEQDGRSRAAASSPPVPVSLPHPALRRR